MFYTASSSPFTMVFTVAREKKKERKRYKLTSDSGVRVFVCSRKHSKSLGEDDHRAWSGEIINHATDTGEKKVNAALRQMTVANCTHADDRWAILQ